MLSEYLVGVERGMYDSLPTPTLLETPQGCQFSSYAWQGVKEIKLPTAAQPVIYVWPNNLTTLLSIDRHIKAQR